MPCIALDAGFPCALAAGRIAYRDFLLLVIHGAQLRACSELKKRECVLVCGSPFMRRGYRTDWDLCRGGTQRKKAQVAAELGDDKRAAVARVVDSSVVTTTTPKADKN